MRSLRLRPEKQRYLELGTSFVIHRNNTKKQSKFRLSGSPSLPRLGGNGTTPLPYPNSRTHGVGHGKKQKPEDQEPKLKAWEGLGTKGGKRERRSLERLCPALSRYLVPPPWWWSRRKRNAVAEVRYSIRVCMYMYVRGMYVCMRVYLSTYSRVYGVPRFTYHGVLLV